MPADRPSPEYRRHKHRPRRAFGRQCGPGEGWINLGLANAGEQVGMVLELTGMDRVLTPYSSSEEAFRNG